MLVPPAMALLGDRCWYLPQWLRWLPGGEAEAALGPRPAAEAAPARLPAWPHPARAWGVCPGRAAVMMV